MADRTGKIYGGKIFPDDLVEESSSNEDLTLQRAIQWLKEFEY